MAYRGGAADIPNVRHISTDDLKDALRRGFDDFLAMPSHVAFVCLIYPILGVYLASMAFGYDVLPLLYPLISGFALVGPLAAIGLYELSRRRERGLDTNGATPSTCCAPPPSAPSWSWGQCWSQCSSFGC
jgi:uncharacterized membrane protein